VNGALRDLVVQFGKPSGKLDAKIKGGVSRSNNSKKTSKRKNSKETRGGKNSMTCADWSCKNHTCSVTCTPFRPSFGGVEIDLGFRFEISWPKSPKAQVNV